MIAILRRLFSVRCVEIGPTELLLAAQRSRAPRPPAFRDCARWNHLRVPLELRGRVHRIRRAS